MVMFGTHRYGVTDKSAGLFHVTTTFFHFNLLPVAPLASFVVFPDGQQLKIPLSLKSWMLAWARFVAAFMVLVVWTAVIASIFNRAVEKHVGFWVVSGVMCAGTLWLWWFVTFSRTCRHASLRRALRVCQQAGLDDEWIEALHQAFALAAVASARGRTSATKVDATHEHPSQGASSSYAGRVDQGELSAPARDPSGRPRSRRLPAFCLLMFIIDVVFCALRLIVALNMEPAADANAAARETHEVLKMSSILVAAVGIPANCLLLAGKRLGLFLGVATLIVAVGSEAVILAVLGSPDKGWGFIAFRLILNAFYAIALLQFARWHRQFTRQLEPADWMRQMSETVR